MTLERFLHKVPDEISDEVPELHFTIPARTHPHVRSKTINGEKDVDRSERSKQYGPEDEVEEDDVAEDEVEDDDVEDDGVGG